MIRFFQWLIFGHCHKWKIIAKAEVEGSYPIPQGKINGEFTKYTIQCETCGKLRTDFS